MTINITFMEFAKCKDIDTNFFFSENVSQTNQAIAFCQDCPVKTPCGQYAMDNNIGHGVWGGLSVRSRVRIKREQKQSQLV